ncbi:MAG: CPBP family intramembrane glutamic endopeptidase [Burkholderiaceae bacterium]
MRRIVAEAPRERDLRFRAELHDFIRFVARPRFTPRLPRRSAANGRWEDWFPTVSFRRMLQWAFFLWVVNLIVLGPIAVFAATEGGAQHRLDLANVPWLQALLWAPVVEELVFRYGLRHIAQSLWVVPLAVYALLAGPQWVSFFLVVAILLICWRPYFGNGWAHRSLPWRFRVRYCHWFPVVFHLSSLAFAAMHLNNFSMHGTSYWLMPLLVLPQWLTGMVLGWLRVKRGIGASMLLHGIFNGGPLLIVWIVLHTVPGLVT